MGCCSSNSNVKVPTKDGQNDNGAKRPVQSQGVAGATKLAKHGLSNQLSEKNERIDTPLITEQNMNLNSPLKEQAELNQSKQANQQFQIKPKNYQFFDISPKVLKKHKIYHISSNFPVVRPYSNNSEWQNVLSKIQSVTEEELVMKLLKIRNRNWIQEQIKLQIEESKQNGLSLDAFLTSRKSIQIREQFNWLVWAISQYYFNQMNDPKIGLPKSNAKKWTDGFEFKGLYIKVLPYEEAYYVHNEIQGLKYVHLELMELDAMAQSINQQYGQIKENLHKDVILPLIAAVNYGGFYLYATPVIFTQELDAIKEKEFFNNTLNASKIAAAQNSMHNSVQMQAIQNQSNLSFSYLHNNINPGDVTDSLFKFMPILKNITTRNMIPIIDFDEFNDNRNEDKLEVELKYFLVNLFDCIPKLSETSASTIMMRYPCFINEEISFHKFPKNNYMEFRELKRMINSDSEIDLNEDDDDIGGPALNQDPSSMFSKKFFTKHGWDFTLMYKKGLTQENRRATNFFLSREIPIRRFQSQQEQNNMLFIEEYMPNDDNFEQLQKQRYVSPQKQSVLKRSESITEENKICGNVLIAAYNFKKDFRLKYSMINHTYSTSKESYFSASIEQVVKIIEQSDNMYNQQSLKELLHRKGLNMRFEWAVLSKLRLNQNREMVMIDILIRVMRRIIHEEVKLKCRTQQTAQMESGTILEEFYQGNQSDVFKEVLIYYVNTILKRKISKHKQVFEETLLGLFLSRMSIFGIVHDLNLKKEEFFYLESRDILEDIIEAPSKNPSMFINFLMSYFKIEFKNEFLRIVRQDKLVFLNKGQPLTKDDFKTIQFRVNTFFNIREQVYFILAKQIGNNKKKQNSKLPGKIKTKSEKDEAKLKQSFQKPKKEGPIISQRDYQNLTGTQSVNNSMMEQDSQTQRNKVNNQHEGARDQQTIRQYKNMDNAIINESSDFNSPPLNQSKLKKISTQDANRRPTGNHSSDPYDFTKLSKRNSFKPTSIQEIIMPSVLYKLRTFLSNNPYNFDQNQQNSAAIGDTFTVLQSFYEMPTLEIVEEWIIVAKTLVQDVYSVNGHEQVLLEAYVTQALLIYFFRNDLDDFFKILALIRDHLFLTSYCSPETLIMIQILTGLYFEEKREQGPLESEKSYLTAMICIFQLYGDPRGRGNYTMPFSLYLSWKLSILSLIEDKKIHDSEFSEELFDASLRCLNNHKKHYKDQQLIYAFTQNLNKEQPNIEVLLQKSKFEQEVEKFELQKQIFDIKKYKNKPFNITFASGLPKSNTYIKKNQQQAMSIYVSQGHNFNKARQFQEEEKKKVDKKLESKDSLKSKSVVPGLKKRQSKQHNDYDLEPSDIDLEIEDENKNYFVEENFKNNEWMIGNCPFQHWSIYRNQINQILNAHNLNKNQQALAYQKQMYRDMLQKFLAKDIFYQWIVKFNPIMYQSGIQWSNQFIKEIIFCQNQQMVSSSSSSVVLSHHNMSNQSLSSTPSSAKERKNYHLGSYSQILGKEFGGISKQDMNGVLFAMGTDSCGQLGLDIITTSENQSVSLKVLYPRMITTLRDEIIKEICCGHSHTLVLNIHGQVYSWGLNESSQLGLGPEAPKIVRRPIFNPYLQSVSKLSAGNEHSLAITKNNELYIWGGGGLTGLNSQDPVTIPQKMEFFNKTKIHQAVCGGLHTVVVTKEGEIYSWGSTEGGQLGLPQQMVIQLCKGQEIPVLTPQKIPGLEGKKIEQVACGEAHTIAMTKEGDLYGWGMSNYGQLGLGFSSDSFEPGSGMEKSKVYEPRQITHLKNENVTKIICGSTFTLFQTEKGDLYGCGMNDMGQIGLDTFMEELQIATLEKAKRGKHHQTSDVTVPTKVICFQGIALKNIACGENHALAVSGDDSNMLWAWGMFRQGQLGLGEVSMKMNPRPVQTLCSSLINRIACGSGHSLALIGETSQISTLSAQFYAGNENLTNYWQCDIRGLGTKDNRYDLEDMPKKEDDGVQDEVIGNGGAVVGVAEGKIKNPK